MDSIRANSVTTSMGQEKDIGVCDIMTEKFVSISPDASIADAAKLLEKHQFDGVPVVEGAGTLAGILTEYDLISHSSAIHLPTLQIVLKNLSAFKEDRSKFAEETKEISKLRVRDVMNKEPLTLPDTATYKDVIAAFRRHHRVNPIPVMSKDHKVVGVVSRCDILKPYRLLGEE